jgi:hypothetical protein
LSSEPKIHRRRGKEQRGERRVPRTVKNIARDYEEIFPRVPGMDAPVSGDDDYKKDDEGERIEKHDRRDCLSKRHADGQYILPDHFEVDSDLTAKDKINKVIDAVWLEG